MMPRRTVAAERSAGGGADGSCRPRPLLLDLFSGGGAAAEGYSRAGFDVIGLDHVAQRYYPFPIVRADALRPPFDLRDFDGVHASPPCQGYSQARFLRADHGVRHPLLIPNVLRMLEASGVPYVVENVPGSGMGTHVRLCGSMFSLGAEIDGEWHQLRRHRDFLCSWFWLVGLQCHHVRVPIGNYGNGGAYRLDRRMCSGRRIVGDMRQRSAAMGIDWLPRAALAQAVPPAYTEYIGRSLMAYLTASGRWPHRRR